MIFNQDWKKDYEKYTDDPRDIRRLREGVTGLAASWHMQAMYKKWKRIKGIKD